jgi:hypothetical protein
MRRVPAAHRCLGLLYVAVLMLSLATLNGGFLPHEAVALPVRQQGLRLGQARAIVRACEKTMRWW